MVKDEWYDRTGRILDLRHGAANPRAAAAETANGRGATPDMVTTKMTMLMKRRSFRTVRKVHQQVENESSVEEKPDLFPRTILANIIDP